jgi:hypothetical protein
MSTTTPAGMPILFNALSGVEVREKILRDIREAFDKDERFRHHQTYPNLKFAFSLSMKYEPGMVEAVNVSGNVDARSKIEAQEGVIVALRKQLADRDERFQEIEAQANLLLSDNEKKTRDLADANEFIKKLHAEKLELEKTVSAAKGPLAEYLKTSTAEPVFFDLEALKKGEPIVVEHESEVIDEPDRLRESGETLNPEAIEIEVEGGGEATGEVIPQMAVVGKSPSQVSNLDPSLRLPTEGTGATVSSGRAPAGVKGRPRS